MDNNRASINMHPVLERSSKLERGSIVKRWITSQWMQQAFFVGPAILFYSIVIAIPFFFGIYYSMTSWDGVSGNAVWVGLNNFSTIFLKDPEFGQSFWFTTRFTLTAVILNNVIGFALAYLLSLPLKSRSAIRTIFFLPNVLGGLVLGFIWQFILVQGFPGIGKLTNLSFFTLPWLGTEATAYWALIIVSVWQGAGYLMVIYIAGLANVPKDLIEASVIDGAGKWQILKNIIIPLIMPTVTVCLFISISWTFKMFDLNYSLTSGGPYGSTESVAMNIYNEAFGNNRYGLGTAKALIFFVAVTFITLIQVKLTKSREVEM